MKGTRSMLGDGCGVVEGVGRSRRKKLQRDMVKLWGWWIFHYLDCIMVSNGSLPYKHLLNELDNGSWESHYEGKSPKVTK